ncbi:hypothetical protein GWI33_011978 [Rhynchophorus ferrugineus]|uniref:Uncharacterized protein n=1 Tax=Rhynchophorus ferrugineus TaxID=354439 RepID=A0A834IU77_RHYFE|nr:hypothetical protein GWI33_011978 [Rhynchophorus ferrugineus]
MKRVNHGENWRAVEGPVQFSAFATLSELESASSKLLHINLFAAVLVTLIMLRHIERNAQDRTYLPIINLNRNELTELN